MLALPDDFTQTFCQQLTAYEEELTMRCLSTVERHGVLNDISGLSRNDDASNRHY